MGVQEGPTWLGVDQLLTGPTLVGFPGFPHSFLPCPVLAGVWWW